MLSIYPLNTHYCNKRGNKSRSFYQ